MRLHDMRHYMATTLLSAGWPVGKVSRRLGHSSQATTTRIYDHWIDGEDEGMADFLDSVA